MHHTDTTDRSKLMERAKEELISAANAELSDVYLRALPDHARDLGEGEVVELATKDHRYGRVFIEPRTSGVGEEQLEAARAAVRDIAIGLESLESQADRDTHDELRKLNRSLRMLSDANEAVIHTSDEPTLLREICNIVVKVGGYRFAWIGLPQNDPEKTTRVAASCGVAPEREDEMKFSWADNERGRGPSGVAIRTGEPQLVRDTLTDPAYESWRVLARECGYRSGIALPLKIENRVLGALSVYSSEPDAFTPDEIELLEELAGDLAFGMTGLRARMEQEKAEQAIRALNRELLTLHRLSEVGLAARTPECAYDEIIEEISLATGFSFVAIERYDRDRQMMVFEALRGFPLPEGVERLEVPVDATPSGVVAKTGRPVVEFDPAARPEHRFEHLRRLGVHTFVSVPMVFGETVVGALSIGSTQSKDVDKRLVRLLQSVANFVASITERMRVEQALRASEERLKLALDAANDGLYDWNLPTGDAYMSPKYYTMLGYEPGEFASNFETWKTLVHPDDLGNVLLYLENRQSTGVGDYSSEFRMRTKSGEWRWILSRGRIVERDSQGNPVRMIGTHVDITERKRTEESIRLNEARLEALLRLNQVGKVSLQEIADFALEEAVKLTSSTIGYLAFTNEDESVLIMFSWSSTARETCNIPDKPLVYPVDKTGLWGEAVRQRRPVITNDYPAPNPLKKGFPAGHVELTRHMNAPIFDGDRIVAVAGVANKSEEYDEADVRQLVLLMDGMWRIVQRNQAEENRRTFERQVEAQKRQFYRDTILSVTDAKLDICDAPDVRPYISKATRKFDILEPVDVGYARHEAAEFLRQQGLTGERLEGFMVGVGEAMTNAIKHAHQGRVHMGKADDSVWVAVTDKGPGIGSLILPRATLLRGFSTKPSLGLGYSIMMEVSDRILLKTNAHGTTVVLVKNLREPDLRAAYDQLPDTWANIPD